MRPYIFVLALCFLTAAALLEKVQAGEVIERIRATNELVLGTPGDFPPFSVTSEQGELLGFDISLARELARTMGVNLRIVRLPFSALPENLLAGEVDIIMTGLSITAKRNMDIAFIGPYGNSGQAFLGNKEIIERLEDPLDLNRENLSIAVLKDTTADITVRVVLPKTNLVYTGSLDEALIKLLKKEVDGLISDYPYCKVAEFRYKTQGIQVFEKVLTFEQLGIGISPDDFLFANLLRNYLNLVAGSGALEAMQEYWFKNSNWVKDLPDLNVLKNF
jgi:polar amino acid transport system substrate-binding protein